MKDKNQKAETTYIKALLPLHMPGPLTYIWPYDKEPPKRGTRLLVPLKNRQIIGISWGIDDSPKEGIRYREVAKVLDETPLLTEKLTRFIVWASSYYFYPLGQAMGEALPSELISARAKGAKRIARAKAGPGRSRLELLAWEEARIIRFTPEQDRAISVISKEISSRTFSPILLFGVTGSGKTAVYIEACKSALKEGRGCLVMVPEIAMTAQLASRFTRAFGENVAILHSGLTPAQRRDQWWRLRMGKCKVALGTRSAIFCPINDLGLIVVDEEHDPSYKQEERFRYNARDLAVVRAKMEGATVVLGSGTPSVASFFNAKSGRYRLLELTQRPSGAVLPAVEIVDRRGRKGKGPAANKEERDEPKWLSQELRNAVEETLSRGEQVLLFLNRRGLATYVFCPACGYVFKCDECDVILTWHRRNRAVFRKKVEEDSGRAGPGLLACHYCGKALPALPVCPKCKNPTVKTSGFGTEKVAEDLVQAFAGITVARMDRDTLTSRKKMEGVLRAFRSGRIDCLVGTQMVTKGHDFPNLTLVGVIWADMSLNVPEFNASERTFHILSQVAGRAGRAKKPGRVLIQTYMPSHYSIQKAATHDFEGFYLREVELREKLGYPPFSRLINLKFSGRKKSNVELAAEKTLKFLKGLSGSGSSFSILGPVPCPKGRIKSRYRYQLLLKGKLSQIRNLAAAVDKASQSLLPGGVRLEIDVDPINFM